MHMVAGQARLAGHVFKRCGRGNLAVEELARDLQSPEQLFLRRAASGGNTSDLCSRLSVERCHLLGEDQKVFFETAGLQLLTASFRKRSQ